MLIIIVIIITITLTLPEVILTKSPILINVFLWLITPRCTKTLEFNVTSCGSPCTVHVSIKSFKGMLSQKISIKAQHVEPRGSYDTVLTLNHNSIIILFWDSPHYKCLSHLMFHLMVFHSEKTVPLMKDKIAEAPHHTYTWACNS